jgi:hypothetical protein
MNYQRNYQTVVKSSMWTGTWRESYEKLCARFLRQHQTLDETRKCGSLDPLQAKKAIKRQGLVFAKLQAQTRGL